MSRARRIEELAAIAAEHTADPEALKNDLDALEAELDAGLRRQGLLAALSHHVARAINAIARLLR